jgi:hypothetical protein
MLRKRFARRKTALPGWTIRVFDMAQKRAQKRSVTSRLQVLQQDIDLDKALPI